MSVHSLESTWFSHSRCCSCLHLFCRDISLPSACSSALTDPAAELIDVAVLIASWLSHRGDTSRLFGTTSPRQLRRNGGWSQPGALHGQRNKQATYCDTLGLCAMRSGRLDVPSVAPERRFCAVCIWLSFHKRGPIMMLKMLCCPHLQCARPFFWDADRPRPQRTNRAQHTSTCCRLLHHDHALSVC